MTTAAERAARLAIFKAGGVVQVGRALGITHNAVIQWKKIPPARVAAMAKLTGMKPHEIRPDLYPPR